MEIKITSNKKHQRELLRFKRERHNTLTNNFIFRKIFKKTEIKGKYEQIATAYDKLFTFNWNSRHLINAKIDLSNFLK